MKKIIFFLLLFINCSAIDPGFELIIEYPGSFFVSIYNRTNGVGKVYCIEDKGIIAINEKKLESIIGELNYIEISAHKVYEPYSGILIIEGYTNGDIMFSTTAEENIREAEISYQF